MTTINKLPSVDSIDDGDLFPLFSNANMDARKASASLVKNYIAGTIKNETKAEVFAELAESDGATLVGWAQAATGSVPRTVDAKLREFVSVKDFGAVGDGVADDTEAINAAIADIGAAGGGTVYFPTGTYLVGDSNPSAVSWDNNVAIWVKSNNVHLKGAGRAATKIKLKNAGDAHVIKFGQRATATVLVSDCSVSGMELDGNRSNQTAPTVTDDHWNGVDISTGCVRITVEDLYIHDTQYYGVGLGRQNTDYCKVLNCDIVNTGADGIDCKDDDGLLLGVVIENVSVSGFGLAGALSQQAGINVRGGCSVSNCTVTNFAGDKSGFRIDGSLSASNTVQSKIIGCSATATAKDTSFGFQITNNLNSFNAMIDSCFASGANIGFYVPAERAQLVNVDAYDCYAGVDVTNNSQVTNAKARNCTIGYRARGSNACLTNIRATNNTTGIQFDAGATDTKVHGGVFTSNTANVSDSGTNTAIDGVTGIRTNSVSTANVAIDSTGTKVVTIAHNLDFTPNLDDVSLSFKRNTNVGDWSMGFYCVYNADATNVYCNVRVLTASATAGATVTMQAHCVAKKAPRQ